MNPALLADGTILTAGAVLPGGANLPDGQRLGEDGPWVFPNGTRFPGGVKIDKNTILPDRSELDDGTRILGPDDDNEVRPKGFECKGSYKADGHIFHVWKSANQAIIKSYTAPADSVGWPANYDDRPPLDTDLPLPCFMKGTQIATASEGSGMCLVENLEIGDLILTASGEEVEVKWIGHKTHENRPEKIEDNNPQPVRIRAGALGVDRSTAQAGLPPIAT